MIETKDTQCCNSGKDKQKAVVFNDLKESKTSVFTVSGMDCADEITAIQNALSKPKIGKVTANLMTSQVTVEHEQSLSESEIISLINSAGVRVREAAETTSFYTDNKKRVLLVGISGSFLLIGLLSQWFLDAREAVLLALFLMATLFGGSLILPKAIRALKQKSLDMNVLMTMAAIGAFIIREYSEGAAVVFLFSLAEMLEAFSVARARKAIREILSITPQTVTLKDGGIEKILPVEQVEVGNTILVLAGERIPLDGTVLTGSSSVNQAPLTGESQPVAKNPDDIVLAGTINESGTLKIRVTHTFKDSKISNVIRLIEEAQSKKAPAQLFVDKFSRIYTPIVTLVAVLVALIPPLAFSGDWQIWFYRSLVFLVIACPCALVIATPVSIVSALTALAKSGVLIKGGVFLESLGKIRALAVDKTGTITEGKPRVVSTQLFNKKSELELLTIVRSLENHSTHPLARAAVKYCEQKNALEKEVVDFKVIQGKGIQGQIEGHLYFAGNHKLAHELGVCTSELELYLATLEDKAQSVLVVGHMPHENCAGDVFGVLGLADEPRSNVIEAIQSLHRVGIKEISMLSGDNQRTVSSIAKRVHIDTAIGDLLPESKVTEIQSLLSRHKYVAMVGDGINDAPALAQATIGVAMGAAGTDAAIETADVALMTDDLTQLARAVSHGRKALGIIRFNISFALVIKAVFIALSLFGLSNLWIAVAADMGASLLVIANSMRLLKVETINSAIGGQ